MAASTLTLHDLMARIVQLEARVAELEAEKAGQDKPKPGTGNPWGWLTPPCYPAPVLPWVQPATSGTGGVGGSARPIVGMAGTACHDDTGWTIVVTDD